MIKDKIHSDKAKEINYLKKEATKTQVALKSLKNQIADLIRTDHRDDINNYFTLLGVTRLQYKSLCEQIRNLNSNIKAHQRSIANQWMNRRMYALVLRQLNPMQKGIQALHAVAEYGQMTKRTDCAESVRVEYDTWADRDKTMIILDAGVSTDIVDACAFLTKNNVKFEVFREPDLYGCVTAICFVADERVFNTEKYPSYEEYIYNSTKDSILSTKTVTVPTEKQWIRRIFAGHNPETILALRDFIFSKKLAN